MAASSREIRARRQQMLLRLLVRLFRVMNDETVRRVRDEGFPLQPSFPRLLAYVDEERGSRVSALAKKLGVTRQAVSQLLDEIEAEGCVERRPDPTDGRAVRVHFTPKGRRMLACGMRAMTAIEAEYAALIGKAELGQVKAHLARLLEQIDPEGELGAD
jgi:DNA-binding MarR family transcriptional regulator